LTVFFSEIPLLAYMPPQSSDPSLPLFCFLLGLLNGRLPRCEICNNYTLRTGGFFGNTTVFCKGWFSATTRCEFIAEGDDAKKIERQQFAVPEAAMGSKKAKNYLRINWGENAGTKDWEARVPAHQEALPIVDINGAAAAGSKRSADDGGTAGPAPKKAKKAAAKKAPKKAKIKAGSGLLQVDEEAPSGKIYVGEDGTLAYNATCALTDIERSINKFYVIQVLETPTGAKPFCCYKKWGRVGEENVRSYYARGGDTLANYHATVEDAIVEFSAKFTDLTGNDFTEKDAFVQKNGRYDYIEMTGAEEEPKPTKAPAKKKAKKGAKAEVSIQEEVVALITMITDPEMHSAALRAQNINTDKMPLGTLSKRQKQAGYDILSKLQTLLESTGFDMEDKATLLKLKDLSNSFYTKIPHIFGTKETPPLISDMVKAKAKLDLMDTLINMGVARETLACRNVDEAYADLHCGLKTVEKASGTYAMLEKYLKNTHGETHNVRLTLEDAFAVEREGETERFAPHKDDPNRQLLWHGSRLTNWVGILKQGLRIAPPEAPVTGYMFGKGVYFASMATKSAQYCFPSTEQPYGILILCEVALGEMLPLKQANPYADKKCIEEKKASTWGIGRNTPDPNEFETEGGVHIPLGKGVDMAAERSAGDAGGPGPTGLQYDEYIVYRESQVKIKYALKVKFNLTGRYGL